MRDGDAGDVIVFSPMTSLRVVPSGRARQRWCRRKGCSGELWARDGARGGGDEGATGLGVVWAARAIWEGRRDLPKRRRPSIPNLLGRLHHDADSGTDPAGRSRLNISVSASHDRIR